MPEPSWTSAEAWGREATRLGNAMRAAICRDCEGVVPVDGPASRGFPWNRKELRWCRCGSQVTTEELVSAHGVGINYGSQVWSGKQERAD